MEDSIYVGPELSTEFIKDVETAASEVETALLRDFAGRDSEIIVKAERLDYTFAEEADTGDCSLCLTYACNKASDAGERVGQIAFRLEELGTAGYGSVNLIIKTDNSSTGMLLELVDTAGTNYRLQKNLYIDEKWQLVKIPFGSLVNPTSGDVLTASADTKLSIVDLTLDLLDAMNDKVNLYVEKVYLGS